MRGWEKKRKSSAIDLIAFSSSNNDYKGTTTNNYGIHLKLPTLKEHRVGFYELAEGGNHTKQGGGEGWASCN